MKLEVGNEAETDAMPDSLLQTVGIMKILFRSLDFIEERLSELAGLKDLDPRLRREVQLLRDAMSKANSEAMFRLSLMGTIVTDLLKEAKKGQCSDLERIGEATQAPGRGGKGRNRLDIVRDTQG
jgi:hypothetical protein